MKTPKTLCNCMAFSYADPREHEHNCAVWMEYRRRLDAKNAARREQYGALRSLGMRKTPYGWE